jgi:hypothetical protein
VLAVAAKASGELRRASAGLRPHLVRAAVVGRDAGETVSAVTGVLELC